MQNNETLAELFQSIRPSFAKCIILSPLCVYINILQNAYKY